MNVIINKDSNSELHAAMQSIRDPLHVGYELQIVKNGSTTRIKGWKRMADILSVIVYSDNSEVIVNPTDTIQLYIP